LRENAKMNLGFDIDGVISDFVKTFIGLVKRRYDLVLREADIYCHDLNLVLGISIEERNQLIRDTLKEDLALNAGAKEVIEKLYSEGHRIFILTARPEDLAEVTRAWLKKKGIPYTERVQLNEGKKYLAKADLDLIVEDNLEDALEWSQRVKNILVYDHPWNQTLNVKGLIKRVYNWDEILSEVQRLKVEPSPKISSSIRH
jgi:uncharacterized HAD superfamily protein